MPSTNCVGVVVDLGESPPDRGPLQANGGHFGPLIRSGYFWPNYLSVRVLVPALLVAFVLTVRVRLAAFCIARQ